MAKKSNGEQSQRVSNAEKARRVDACVELVIKGYTNWDIWLYVQEQDKLKKAGEPYDKAYAFGVSESQVCRYCQDAAKRIEEITLPTRKVQYKKQVARYERLFNKALESKDIRAARLILNSIDKLTGLDWTAGEDGKDIAGEETYFLLPGGVKIPV
jgi:hypothetical protein